jgi:hypothetical protein
LGAKNVAEAARIHEKIHRFFTPKLQIFREIRVVLAANSTLKSYLLRYMEELICEMGGQLGAGNLGKVLQSVTFPVKNGYMTWAKMGIEVKGILLGPINAGGVIYSVYFSQHGLSRDGWQEAELSR